MSLKVDCVVCDPFGNCYARREICPAMTHGSSRSWIAANQQEQHKGVLAKTAEFVNRFVVGSLGSALPLGAAVAWKYYTKADSFQVKQLYEFGICAAALGLSAASVTSTPSGAFNRGIQFGSVAQIFSSLGGTGKGIIWDKTVIAAHSVQAAVVAIPGVISGGYSTSKTWVGQQCSKLRDLYRNQNAKEGSKPPLQPSSPSALVGENKAGVNQTGEGSPEIVKPSSSAPVGNHTGG